jgi:hypothetical protein
VTGRPDPFDSAAGRTYSEPVTGTPRDEAGVTPGQALYVANANAWPDDDSVWVPWPSVDAEGRAIWERLAQTAVDTAVAGTVHAANGSAVIVAFREEVTEAEADEMQERWAEFGPEGTQIVIVGDVAAITAQPAPAVTVDSLAAALDGREILVNRVHGQPGEVVWRGVPLRPHGLAVQLLTSIDKRLTDDPQPQPAPELTRVFQGQAPAPEGVTTSASGMQPAPEMAAAMAETRAALTDRDKYRNWLDDFTRVVLDVSDRMGLMRAAVSLRKKAGFEP